MLAVKIVKKKRYMVQGFEKKKTVINVTSIQERFEERRTVVKPRFFMEGHEDISKERAKWTTHTHAIDLLINTIVESKVAVSYRKR